MQNKSLKRPAWWQDEFGKNGYKLTMSRNAIFDILLKIPGHLSAEDIFMKVRPRYPRIGLTTIYRTLDLSVNLGMVNRLDFGDGQARYELSGSPGETTHHHHLVCTNCKKVVDYSDFIEEELKLLQETEKGLSKKYNFRITNHLVQFYGLCADCAAAQMKGGGI